MKFIDRFFRSSRRDSREAPSRLHDAASRVDQLETRLTNLQSAYLRERLLRQNMMAAISSGVDISMGRFNIEKTPEMMGRNRWAVYQKMANDQRISEVLRLNSLPLIQARWVMQPGGDSSKDHEIAEFVGANLYHFQSSKYGPEYWSMTPWIGQRLPEILDFNAAGFSMFHRSWKVVNGKLVVDHLKWLEPESVDPYGWVLDNQDRIVEVQRTYKRPDGTIEHLDPLSGSDIQLYVRELRGARYEGVPILRVLYGAWLRRDRFLRWSLVHAQRAYSPSPIGYWGGGSGQGREEFEEFVERQAVSPQEGDFFVVDATDKDNKTTVEYPGSDIDADRLASVTNAANSDIAHGGGAKTMIGGETEFGSRSVTDSQMGMEMMLVQATAMIVASQEFYGVGTQDGLIQRLVDENFEGAKGYPRLIATRVSTFDIDATLTRVAKLKVAGLIPDHPEIIKQVVALAGLDVSEKIIQESWEETQRMKREKMQFDRAAQKKFDRDNDSGEGGSGREPDVKKQMKDGETASDMSMLANASYIATLLEPQEGARNRAYFRQPNKLEGFVDLGGVSMILTDTENAIRALLRNEKWAMTEEIVRRRKKKILVVRNIESQSRSKWKGQNVAVARLKNLLRDIAQRGAEDVARELKNQSGESGALSSLAVDDVRIGGVRIGTRSGIVDEALTHVAEFTISWVWNWLIGLAIEEYMRLERERLNDEDLLRRLENFLDGLSEKSLLPRARGASTVAYNQGRAAAIVTAKDARIADFAVRSEILDDRVCDVCRQLDGKIVEIGTDEFWQYMPPAKCLGGENCRGFYVAVAKRAAA